MLKQITGHRQSVHVCVSHFVPSLISLKANVRCFDDGCIDLPVNNLGPLIRRFNAPDRELILNIRGLEGRKDVEAALSLDESKQRLRDAMKLEP